MRKNKKEIKKAVIYARFSCDKQRDESIEDQLRVCTEYADSHGILIVDHYCDFAISGRTDHRPQFQNMIEDAAEGTFDAVLVYKTDRFARNRYDSAIYKKKLIDYGVKVISATEEIPDGGGGIIMESMYESLAELYSIQISQNVRRAAKGNALKSHSNGGHRLLGYKTNPVTRRYEICEEEAKIVREIFSKASAGKPLRSIIDYLHTAHGLEMSYCRLTGMLQNERYTGVYIYDGIKNDGGMPAIISRDTFDDVQRFFKIRYHNTNSFSRYPNQKYLFSRRAFCGKCGSSITGETTKKSNGKEYKYYACMGHKMHQTDCDMKRIKADIVERAAINALLVLITQPDIMHAIISKAEKYQDKKPQNNKAENLQQQLAETQHKKENILNALEEGVFSSSIKARLKDLETQELKLKSEIIKEDKKIKFTNISPNQFQFFLEKLKTGEAKSKIFVNSLFYELISKVFMFPDRIVLVYKLTNEPQEEINSNDLKNAEFVEMQSESGFRQQKNSERISVRSFSSWLPE